MDLIGAILVYIISKPHSATYNFFQPQPKVKEPSKRDLPVASVSIQSRARTTNLLRHRIMYVSEIRISRPEKES